VGEVWSELTPGNTLWVKCGLNLPRKHAVGEVWSEDTQKHAVGEVWFELTQETRGGEVQYVGRWKGPRISIYIFLPLLINLCFVNKK
jgi:hypothetical protein